MIMDDALLHTHSPDEYSHHSSPFRAGSSPKTSSQSSSWLHPFRRNSGSSTSSLRGKKDEVVVFIRSTDEVCLKDRAEVQVQAEKTPPLSTVDLPRYPWAGEKEVYVPTAFGAQKHDAGSKRCSCCEWAATIELDSISPGFRFRRVAGNVRKLFVFDKPIES
ncbi:hypothetical protein BC567DRAFT_228076 [Phyllosticta citribraziliensis]